jgi:ubiquinone/menaquinone biosynthesis C-methylase UbiE
MFAGHHSLRQRMTGYPGWLRFFLQIFFKLLYHQFAWMYDWVAAAVSLGSWRDWVTSIMPYLDVPKVLELGHGPGYLQAALARQGRLSVGLDESDQMGRLARQNARKQNAPVRIIRARAQQLPFKDESFERVVATFPSEYIADPGTLQEIRRVLPRGGKAVILLLAWITGKSLLERMMNWLFRFTGQSFQWDDRYLAPLKEAGFQAHSELISSKSSQLLVIILEKT